MVSCDNAEGEEKATTSSETISHLRSAFQDAKLTLSHNQGNRHVHKYMGQTVLLLMRFIVFCKILTTATESSAAGVCLITAYTTANRYMEFHHVSWTLDACACMHTY